MVKNSKTYDKHQEVPQLFGKKKEKEKEKKNYSTVDNICPKYWWGWGMREKRNLAGGSTRQMFLPLNFLRVTSVGYKLWICDRKLSQRRGIIVVQGKVHHTILYTYLSDIGIWEKVNLTRNIPDIFGNMPVFVCVKWKDGNFSAFCFLALRQGEPRGQREFFLRDPLFSVHALFLGEDFGSVIWE